MLKKKLKILFISGHNILSPKNGPQLHAQELINYFCNIHNCHFIGFSEDRIDLDSFKSNFKNLNIIKLFQINKGVNYILKILFNFILLRPFYISKYYKFCLNKYLIKLNIEHQFDLIHYIGFSQVSIFSSQRIRTKKIINLPDAQSLYFMNLNSKNFGILRSIKNYLDLKLTLIYEKKIFKNFDKILTVSKVDEHYLSKKYKNVTYVPFHIPRDININTNKINNITRKIIFLNPPYKTLDMAIEIISNLLIHKFEITLLSKFNHHKFNHFIKNKNFQIYNWIDDLFSEINKNDIVVLLDCEGSGMPTRSICSMALGVPIVGTDFSFRGLEVQNNIHCLIGNNSLDIINNVIRLAKEPMLYGKISNKSVNLVKNNFDFFTIVDKLNKIFLEI